VGRPDFKPGEGRIRFCVGSTPTLFRQSKQTTFVERGFALCPPEGGTPSEPS